MAAACSNVGLWIRFENFLLNEFQEIISEDIFQKLAKRLEFSVKMLRLKLVRTS